MAGIAIMRITIVTALTVLLVAAGSASATDRHVYADESIQAAVNAAIPGDTIIVHDGTYIENVVVSTTSLTIRSDNGTALTKVVAASPGKHVFKVTADYVNISGFNVTGAKCGLLKAGIFLRGPLNPRHTGSKQCNITGNIITDNNIGIRLRNSDGNKITCNWVHHNNKSGFFLSKGSIDNTIEHNNIIENGGQRGDGSYRWQFNNFQIWNVNATNNYWCPVDSATIDASIWDDEDSLGNWRGKVTFEPFERESCPCAPVPELPTIALLAVGLLALVGCGRTGRKE